MNKDIIIEGKNLDLIRVNNKEQAIQYGKDRGWCTGNKNSVYYDLHYSPKFGDLFVIFEKGKKKPEAQLFISKRGGYEFQKKFKHPVSIYSFFKDEESIVDWLKNKYSINLQKTSQSDQNLLHSNNLRLRRNRIHNPHIKYWTPIQLRMDVHEDINIVPIHRIESTVQTINIEIVRYKFKVHDTPYIFHTIQEYREFINNFDIIHYFIQTEEGYTTINGTDIIFIREPLRCVMLCRQLVMLDIVHWDYDRDNKIVELYIPHHTLIRQSENLSNLEEVLKYFKLVGGDFLTRRIHYDQSISRMNR